MPTAEASRSFEARIRQRRLDNRRAAARRAIEARDPIGAADAIDEIAALDPCQPDLAELAEALGSLRRSRVRVSGLSRYAAAAVFVLLIFSASWIEEPTLSPLRPSSAPVAPLPSSRIVPVAAPSPVVGTAGVETEPEPASALPARPVRVTPPALPPVYESRAEPIMATGAPVAVPARVTSAPAAPMTADAGSASAPAPAPAVRPAPAPPKQVLTDETDRVAGALQRYRAAYDALDVRSAQAVWPAVDERLLARAFDGLESQRLEFDACDVDVQGEGTARAICRGTMSYVPKVGSRLPRLEPRVWEFDLRKTDDNWRIERARVGP